MSASNLKRWPEKLKGQFSCQINWEFSKMRFLKRLNKDLFLAAEESFETRRRFCLQKKLVRLEGWDWIVCYINAIQDLSLKDAEGSAKFCTWNWKRAELSRKEKRSQDFLLERGTELYAKYFSSQCCYDEVELCFDKYKRGQTGVPSSSTLLDSYGKEWHSVIWKSWKSSQENGATLRRGYFHYKSESEPGLVLLLWQRRENDAMLKSTLWLRLCSINSFVGLCHMGGSQKSSALQCYCNFQRRARL